MEHTNPFSHRFDWLAFVDSAEGQRTPVLLLEAEYNRARACWNACEGVPLDEVENLANIGGLNALTVEAGQAYADADALKAQRDELLAGLADMVDWLDDGNRQLSDAAATDVSKARALIAKHSNKEASHG